jgi:transcriptional regulator with PAS, ATPase and Fis domain
MINWEELKHIHVIRKLEEILGSWYSVDILFIDEKGTIRNWSAGVKREFRNPILELLTARGASQQVFTKFCHGIGERVMVSDKAHIIAEGVFQVERCLAAKIAFENEYLGATIAYPFLSHELLSSGLEQAVNAARSADIQKADVEKALKGVRVIPEADLDHFKELVELVSQEIVTFHGEISKREERISALNHELGTRYRYDNMIGKSKPMQDLYLLLDKIKNSESTVLIQGENGTGKELIAKAIHYNSPRSSAAFVTVNCSAFNENLLDSELFGHVKGAFTGAVKDKKGLFEVAHKGTLFLDELGDMSPSMQVKLLRVLQEGTFTPVGGTEMRKVDVRVLAATNKDLRQMVEDSTFREDLYYRINVISLTVPPLRDRKEDIPLLIEFFMDRTCKEKGIASKTLQKRTLEKIYDYPWPGNVRELENEIERVVVLSGNDPQVSPEVLSSRIKDWGEKNKVQGLRIQGKLKDALEEMEKTMIREGLKRTNWNKSRLAKELGISRAGLIMKVEKYGLDKRKLARAAQEAGGSSNEFEDSSE